MAGARGGRSAARGRAAAKRGRATRASSPPPPTEEAVASPDEAEEDVRPFKRRRDEGAEEERHSSDEADEEATALLQKQMEAMKDLMKVRTCGLLSLFSPPPPSPVAAHRLLCCCVRGRRARGRRRERCSGSPTPPALSRLYSGFELRWPRSSTSPSAASHLPSVAHRALTAVWPLVCCVRCQDVGACEQAAARRPARSGRLREADAEPGVSPPEHRPSPPLLPSLALTRRIGHLLRGAGRRSGATSRGR